jgi:hypothetical protein
MTKPTRNLRLRSPERQGTATGVASGHLASLRRFCACVLALGLAVAGLASIIALKAAIYVYVWRLAG